MLTDHNSTQHRPTGDRACSAIGLFVQAFTCKAQFPNHVTCLTVDVQGAFQQQVYLLDFHSWASLQPTMATLGMCAYLQACVL